jgi:hypothetical protein
MNPEKEYLMHTNTPAAGSMTPLPSVVWAEFFRENAETPTPVAWTAEAATLTPDEREAVGVSVAEFQLGESSEGSNLLRFGRRHAEETGDPAYFAALRLFIGEEHRHARDLGRFMDLAGLPRLRKTWGDSAFRFLRRRAGLEGSIAVLVTAEVIATVYYAALRAATASPLLRGLCDRILADEDQHVQFQCERLAILRRHRRGPLARAAASVVHHLLMAGACVLVWRGHRHALRQGGFGAIAFACAVWRSLRHALRIADPARYPTVPPTARVDDHRWWGGISAAAPPARDLAATRSGHR